MGKRKRLLSKETKHRLTVNVAVPIVHLFYRLLLMTTRRVRVQGENRFLKPGIFCVHHGDVVAGVGELLTMRPGVNAISSLSRDGDIIAKFLSLMKIGAIRGGSSKGAESVTRNMKEILDGNQCVVIPVDGPRGPAGEVKPGAIALAYLTGAPLVCVRVFPERAWRLNSWDKMLIPKPFTKMVVRYSDPIFIPKKISKEQREEYRLLVEKTLYDLAKNPNKQ